MSLAKTSRPFSGRVFCFSKASSATAFETVAEISIRRSVLS